MPDFLNISALPLGSSVRRQPKSHVSDSETGPSEISRHGGEGDPVRTRPNGSTGGTQISWLRLWDGTSEDFP